MTIDRRLTDLATAARKSGLKVIELDGWEDNWSNGGEAYGGVLCHHTGSYDGITDATDDQTYARWMAFTGRSDLPPPLCNLALSAEGVVYVAASGNANHAGQAKATGPMPAAADGNRLYIGIEAMNSGSQGWGSKGADAAGNEVTQGEAYARLCAALCEHYDWPADHVRAHKETSVTGKWDPGELDMDNFRKRIATLITEGTDDMFEKEDSDRLQRVEDKLDRYAKGAKERDQRIATRLAKKYDKGVDEILAAFDDES